MEEESGKTAKLIANNDDSDAESYPAGRAFLSCKKMRRKSDI